MISKTGYAAVNGLEMYYEVHGSGQPLVLVHGGLGAISSGGEVLAQLAQTRQVIAVELQAHAHTADIDRPLRYELLGDDIAALISYLGLEKADVLGYSLGAGAALWTAIQHPEVVGKLVIVSTPFQRAGWYPEVLAGQEGMSSAAAPFMQTTPLYPVYTSVAPRPQDFPVLLDKLGDLLRRPYDWSAEVAGLTLPVMLVFGDADNVPASHAARFYELLGGGQGDGGWDGAGIPQARLAILPGVTHYNIFSSPALVPCITPFLDAPVPAPAAG